MFFVRALAVVTLVFGVGGLTLSFRDTPFSPSTEQGIRLYFAGLTLAGAGLRLRQSWGRLLWIGLMTAASALFLGLEILIQAHARGPKLWWPALAGHLLVWGAGVRFLTRPNIKALFH